MLGERIANLRKSKGVSQEELADVLLTSRQAISKWERGESDPDIGRLKDLATYFNVSIDYLLGYDMEDSSVNSFVKRIKKCIDEANYSITIDEIKMIVLKNKNNFNLLLLVIDYLSCYYLINRDDEIANLIIQYAKTGITIYQPNNSYNASINELHKEIASAYAMTERYDLAKAYLEENHVIEAEDLMSECELSLHHYDKAEKITSNLFTKASSLIINSNFTQIRLFLRTNREESALDLTEWSIGFIRSISKSEELVFDVIFLLSVIKAVCQKYVGQDYQETLNFLKNNRNRTTGFKSDNDGFRFYPNQRMIFASGAGEIRKDFLKEIGELKDGCPVYQSALDIYTEIYGED